MLPETAFATIAAGQVHVEPDFLSPRLIRAMRKDAQGLFKEGMFAPDGLTNTAAGLKKEQQGFSKADRQTFRNDAWDGKSGDRLARLELQSRCATCGWIWRAGWIGLRSRRRACASMR